MKNIKKIKRHSKKRRIRSKVQGTEKFPRMSIFKSAKHMNVQIIDDEKQKTLVSASDFELKSKTKKTKTEIAQELGVLIAKKAIQKKITKIKFDRAGFKYHGRIKILADAARKAGLKF